MINSWVKVPSDSDFTMYNFPFGIAEYNNKNYVVSRLGDHIILLSELAKMDVFQGIAMDDSLLLSSVLNPFIAQGKSITKAVRDRLIQYFTLEDGGQGPKDFSSFMVSHEEVRMLLPVDIKDYTDFYSSIEHATNVGEMFRDPENALLPNWRHLPVGYHGRASSIVVSGTDIKRPNGQQKPADGPPVFGPCRLLDFELEVAFIIGKSTDLGSNVPISKVEDHIFGLSLFNDWSARDIQKWEYVPLGPFLGKNFGSTVSPWIVTLEALEPFRVESPEQKPAVLEYLQYDGKRNYDIELFVDIITPNGDINTVSHSNFKYMYWNMCQQLAHHTINGCNINVGDLYASGTISGKDKNSYGSMLEISRQGKNPISMKDGTERKFIQDGDTVVLRGRCKKGDVELGFGICSGKIVA